LENQIDDIDSVSAMTAPAMELRLGQPLGAEQKQALDSVLSMRVVLFIDGSNLFYAAAALGIEIDYLRLLQTLSQGRNLLRAYFYTGVDPNNERQRGFLLWLNRHGYRVVSKELVLGTDGSRKANLNVEIAVDMLRLAPYCKQMILVSGDGHLAYALEALSHQGVNVELISLSSMTSENLLAQVDRYTDLASLQDAIRKQ
jgi:uncharacterized LabA/DUF88 family protein